MESALSSVVVLWNKLTFGHARKALEIERQQRLGPRAEQKRRRLWARRLVPRSLLRRLRQNQKPAQDVTAPGDDGLDKPTDLPRPGQRNRKKDQEETAEPAEGTSLDKDDLYDLFIRNKDAKKKRPLISAIYGFHKSRWILSVFLCIGADCGWVLMPTLIHYVNRFGGRDHDSAKSQQERDSIKDRGFVLVIGLLALQTLQYLCANHADYQLERLAQRIKRTTLIQLLRKFIAGGFVQPNATKTEANVEASSIESSANDLSDAAAASPHVGTVPFAIVVGCVILIYRLKVASIAGLAVFLIGTPIASKVALIFTKRMHAFDYLTHDRRRRMLALVGSDADGEPLTDDERKALVEEIIDLRSLEMHNTRVARAVELGAQVTVSNLPSIGAAVSMCLLQVYGQLDTGNIVLTLTSFHAIRIIITSLPMTVKKVVMGRKSSRKMEKVLNYPGKDIKRMDVEPESELAVCIRDASFTGKPPPTLEKRKGATDENATGSEQLFVEYENVNMTIGKTELVAILSPSTVGQSKIVPLLTNRLSLTKGSGTISCVPSYCAPNTIIVEGPIRKNIKFGAPHDVVRFQKVLHACGMEDYSADGHLNPATHLSEVSKDVQQRACLARALYSPEPIVIIEEYPFLEDEEIFQTAILDFEPERCRIILTSNPAIAERCDRVLHLQSTSLMTFSLEREIESEDSPMSAHTLNPPEADIKPPESPSGSSMTEVEKQEDEELPHSPARSSLDSMNEKQRFSSAFSPRASALVDMNYLAPIIRNSVSDNDSKRLSGIIRFAERECKTLETDDEAFDLSIHRPQSQVVMPDAPMTADDIEKAETSPPPPEPIQPEKSSPDQTETAEERKKRLKAIGWKAYFKAANSWGLISVLSIPYLFSTAGGILVSFWAIRPTLLTGGKDIAPYAHIGGIFGLTFWHGISQYVFLALASLVVGGRAGRNLHSKALHKILDLPRSALQQHNPQQLVHRFMVDVDIATNRAPGALSRFAFSLGNITVSLILTGYLLPYLLAVIVPGVILAFYFCYSLLADDMLLQRTQRRQKAREHEAVAEALRTSPVIRYDRLFLGKVFRLHENWQKTNLLKVEINNWLTLRMSCLASLILFSAAMAIIGAPNHPPLVGAVLIHMFIAVRLVQGLGQSFLGLRRGLNAIKRLDNTGLPMGGKNNEES